VIHDDLRTEFHGELHGIRGELHGLRGELHGLRGELDGLRDELHETRDVLRSEIRAGDEETRRYMRVLHEDLIVRIAALGDAHR
jgi:signal transduction histidine kinase